MDNTNSFKSTPILSTTQKEQDRLSSGTVLLNEHGFLVKNRYNNDAYLQVNKNTTLNFLFSTFRSDLAFDSISYDGFIPIFIELGVNRNSSEQVINSDILINGIKLSGISLISGSTYVLRYPKYFGALSCDNDLVLLGEVFESESYYSYNIYCSQSKQLYFNIKFKNLNAVSLRCNCFVPYASQTSGSVKHYLNFYEFVLENNKWYLRSPKKMDVSYGAKSSYSYYKASGDPNCYYINNFESPILILDYNILYIINNYNKEEKPFYFDRYPEGMYKYSYNDFSNDLNSSDLNLFISIGNSSVVNTTELYSDMNDPYNPYIYSYVKPVLNYDPNSIYYACSNRKFFGNKILVGKRRISEIIGMHGRHAPESKKVTLSNVGTFVGYDIFYHMCGHVMPVDVIDYSLKTVNSQKDIASLNIDSKTASYVDMKQDVVTLDLIGDIFQDVKSFSQYVYSRYTPNVDMNGSSVVVRINSKNINIDFSNKESFAYYYAQISSTTDKIDYDLNLSMQDLVSLIKKNGAFDVMVEMK